MRGDPRSPELITLLSTFYASESEGVSPFERAEAARELQRRYHVLTSKRACVPDELGRFIADLGRRIFSAKEPEKALRTIFGKDLKKGRPRKTDVNRDRAFRMHRLVQSGMSQDAAAARLDTTPDQSDARKFLRAYKEYRSLALEAAAEEAWRQVPAYDDPSEAALHWLAEPTSLPNQ